jgi:hypothetical protein
MHKYNNVVLEQHKHVKHINPFILFSNYLIMFLNLYYHTISQNDYCYIYEKIYFMKATLYIIIK